MKYTIDDLRNRKVVVKNDGTLEQLRKVLQKAFPFDINTPTGSSLLYVRHYKEHAWVGIVGSHTTLPIQSVRDFLVECEFSYGEEVEVSNNKNISEWHRRIFVAYNPIEENEYKFITVTKSGKENSWKYCRKIEPKFEVSIEEIAKKFKIPVDKLIIKD